jgi:hypothetical protein
VNRFVVVAACALALSACGGASGTALKRVTIPFKAGTIELPGNWRFRDAGSVGDHSTWYWYDPTDAFAKLRVIGSGCVGCVSKHADGRTPNPRGEMPQYAAITAAPNPYTLSYQVFDTPYPDDGMVIVTHSGSGITGSLILDLWLPPKKSAEAAQILASFQPH